ncbi:TetR/AcrR family transcriptional regulator C-terminal domain-containing protein [Saccharopolyspora sp. K220]|uniref:TetR/AcrR family transcriptional regulator C-terminal domain-containing protein n=1 Tax=Saccharopolyspora soli TaxID=2926618 RepID=UPI001F561753|nr:TetR/AcrR family transcriptional regulator C-terminal domain-containing protein [Saccharopolyspora soli]MCI2419721.1 TetR/AcrR family transcriptional regulator C-terminal domain-containing protein [Saccharopolyspora soli]
MSSTQRPSPPYRVIAAEIRARIERGDLRPGDRVPSIRQIAQRWGVAVATATRAAAVLREEGLVEPRVGAGTVVSASAHGSHELPAKQATPEMPTAAELHGPGPAEQSAKRTRLLQAAIMVADTEGLDAVSMRRLAAHLGVGPMSLYRNVANKEELLMQMADSAFGEIVLPREGPEGWRAKLELIAREEWKLSRRHLWLPKVVSFTRPLLAPNMMAHTEWTLRALGGLGLSMATRMREALTIHALVLTAAASLAEEVDAEQRTGITLDQWRATQREQARKLPDRTKFPLLAEVPGGTAEDLNRLFEYGLARHLDGFAALIADSSNSEPRRGPDN